MKGRSRLLCSVHRAWNFSVANDAANFLDVISRLPGCSGQASDTVSAYTRVKMEDAPNFIEQYFWNRNAHLFGLVYVDPAGQTGGAKFTTSIGRIAFGSDS